jgi:hypothetical protein
MYKVKANIQMYGAIPDIIDNLGNHNAAFCFAPAKDFAHEAEGVGLDAHGHVFALVAANFFHLGVLGPGTEWNLSHAS